MAIPKWKCLNCNKEFQVGEWECMEGVNHIIPEKRYYLDDAPADSGTDKATGQPIIASGQTIICNIPPDRTVLGADGTARVLPGGTVTFIRGVYSTTNPIEQYWLDRKGGFCTYERWEQVWLTMNQKFEIQKMRWAAEKQRLENDRNELLNQVKKQKESVVRG